MARVFIAIAFSLLLGCRPSVSPQVSVAAKPASSPPAKEQEVAHFCGDCHRTPVASSYPRARWVEEVRRGYEFYEMAGRQDLQVPEEAAVVAYYQALAPEKLSLPTPGQDLNSSPILFRKEVLPPELGKSHPGVAHAFFDPQRSRLLAADMTTGAIHSIEFSAASLQWEDPRTLARLKAPAHVEVHEMFGLDEVLVVADLGTLSPQDHDLGGVYLAIPTGADEYSVQPLLSGIGRVASFAVADFNGDRLLDVAVAEFGYHETGGLHLLLQNDAPDRNDRLHNGKAAELFSLQRLDSRHGTSHVLVQDFDQDGDQDLVTLCSQEFESVDLFVNDGTGDFQRKNVWAAPVPDYGCSCIALVDLDKDGDEDIVLTNGDSMDSLVLKPHHGLQWLENRSQRIDQELELEFEHHQIALVTGAYGCAAGDMDGDGDQDVVLCTMTWENEENNSVCWFEQKQASEDGSLEFERHNLDLSMAQHPSVLLEDFDLDGDLDIVTGEFEQYVKIPVWLTLYWNERNSPN